MRHIRLLALLAVAGMLAAGAAQALTLYSGNYRFDVDVRDERYRSVWDARGNVWVSGSQAIIEVDSPGYQRGRTRVRVEESRRSYRATVRLRDVDLTVEAIDENRQWIPGAQADTSQFMAMPGEYRVEVRIPSEGYSRFGWADVTARLRFGGFLIGERIRVTDRGPYREVEIRFPRRSFGDYGSNFRTLEVQIPSDRALDEGYRKQLARQIRFDLLEGGEHPGLRARLNALDTSIAAQ